MFVTDSTTHNTGNNLEDVGENMIPSTYFFAIGHFVSGHLRSISNLGNRPMACLAETGHDSLRALGGPGRDDQPWDQGSTTSVHGDMFPIAHSLAALVETHLEGRHLSAGLVGIHGRLSRTRK